jgi:ABC-type sugar transport system ATPase subunit
VLRSKKLDARARCSRSSRSEISLGTAALGVAETERAERLIRRLGDQGNPILFVSDDFDQVLRVCDQVPVLRQGRIGDTGRASETNGRELVDMTSASSLQGRS